MTHQFSLAWKEIFGCLLRCHLWNVMFDLLNKTFVTWHQVFFFFFFFFCFFSFFFFFFFIRGVWSFYFHLPIPHTPLWVSVPGNTHGYRLTQWVPYNVSTVIWEMVLELLSCSGSCVSPAGSWSRCFTDTKARTPNSQKRMLYNTCIVTNDLFCTSALIRQYAS